MALHNGVDMVAVLTRGFFSYTYGSAETDNTMDLYLSAGLFEDAPGYIPPLKKTGLLIAHWFLNMIRRKR